MGAKLARAELSGRLLPTSKGFKFQALPMDMGDGLRSQFYLKMVLPTSHVIKQQGGGLMWWSAGPLKTKVFDL